MFGCSFDQHKYWNGNVSAAEDRRTIIIPLILIGYDECFCVLKRGILSNFLTISVLFTGFLDFHAFWSIGERKKKKKSSTKPTIKHMHRVWLFLKNFFLSVLRNSEVYPCYGNAVNNALWTRPKTEKWLKYSYKSFIFIFINLFLRKGVTK